MKSFTRLIPVCGVVALVLLGAPPIASASHETSGETSPAAEARPHTMREVFEQALASVQLRPDQKKAVDELMAQSEERHAPVKAAKAKLMMAIAEQVERGKIDRCELNASIDELAAAKAKAQPGDRAALERLHRILDADQRAKFATGLVDAFHAYEKGREPKEKLEKMAKALHLTDEQKAKIEKIFATARDVFDVDAKRAAKHERWAKILESFKGDKFELDKVAPAEDRAAKVKEHMDKHLWLSEAILPILTHDQRMLAAEKIRSKARHLAPAAEDEEHESANKVAGEQENAKEEGEEEKEGEEED
jgi:Spy/CpxP family protein refolding chaperone